MSSGTAPPSEASEQVRVCAECGADISDRHGSAERCVPCAKARHLAQALARQTRPEVKQQQAAARKRAARERAARKKAEAVVAAGEIVYAADVAAAEQEPVLLPPLGPPLPPRWCRYCGTGIDGKPLNVVFCCTECRTEWLRSGPGRERKRQAQRLRRARQMVAAAEQAANMARLERTDRPLPSGADGAWTQ